MISVIAPAYNNAGEVRKLLESVSRSRDAAFPFEVVIVDDGSADRSIEEAVGHFHFARYIRLEKNSGAAAARNEGARQARYRSLLFLDSDVTVFPDTIARVAAHFSQPEVTAFVGRLDIVPENDNLFFARYKAIMFNSWLPKDDHSTILTPAIGGVRKDLFFSAGGFDETIKGATVEYVRLSYELQKRCVINYFPDVVVRVKLNSFRKAVYTDFYSTMKWVTIFSEYKKFDNHCTSVTGGLGRLAGFLVLVSLPVCALGGFLFIWPAILAVYLFLNRRFFALALKRESPLFFLRSVITHSILSAVTVFGGVAGVVLVVKKRVFG